MSQGFETKSADATKNFGGQKQPIQMADIKRADLRKRGIRPQIPKRVWKTKKNRGRPIKISVPR